jgi:AAA15 family ATPase/GTPase
MIVNFSIENFGPILEKVTLSFEATRSSKLAKYYKFSSVDDLKLLKLAIIYGSNASGKTSILFALDYLRQLILEPLNKKNEKLEHNPFLFSANYQNLNTKLALDFIQDSNRYLYEVEYNEIAIVSESLSRIKKKKIIPVFKRATDLNAQLTKIDFIQDIDTDIKKTLVSNTLWNNTVFGGFLKTNIQLDEFQNIIDWFSNSLKPMISPSSDLEEFVTSRIKSGLISKESVVGILQKADFNISDVIISEEDIDIPKVLLEALINQEHMPKEEKIRLKNMGKINALKLDFEHSVGDIKRILTPELESRGTMRFYGLAGILALLITNNTIFSIDELETSLSPALFEYFLLCFLTNSNSSQVIATTHNIDLLNNKNIYRNDAIWIADKTEERFTNLYSLSDFDPTLVNNNSDIYKIYKTGKLGGAPNLGDYYINLD